MKRKKPEGPKRGLPPYAMNAFDFPKRIVFNLPMSTTQTVSDRINARPRKRPLNVTRKHEKREYHDLNKLTRFIFGPSEPIVRYNNDLLPRTIKIY